MSYLVLNGNNIDVLKQYPDNYFDAVVTDPPYGLGKEPDAQELMNDWVEKGYHEIQGSGFMGKEWDAFVPQPVFWKEVFRVLKHGGHIVAFFGTRTYDWGVMAMRFAGFEVRDCIQWIYGSGFPKSHNISKAIDKMQDRTNEDEIKFVKWLRDNNNLSMQEIDKILGTKSQAFHYFAESDSNRQIPSNENYKIIKEALGLDNSFDLFVENKNKELKDIREVKGYEESIKGWNIKYEKAILGEPITDAAKQWDGWGSALKPANEPIVLARKPLEKGLSIAENVLKWGTGGINIDGCRIEAPDNNCKVWTRGGNGVNARSGSKQAQLNPQLNGETQIVEPNPQGRFPANIILDEEAGKIMDEQSSNRKSNGLYKKEGEWVNKGDGKIRTWDIGYDKLNKYAGEEGGASRFFYCAKASKSERNKGLKGFEEKDMPYGSGGGAMPSGNANNIKTKNSNFHPTVKPVKLMQYLVRLVTPLNGKVLDPFCGSGTTGIACKLEGFEFVGMEQDAEYCKIAEARIKNTIIHPKQNELF